MKMMRGSSENGWCWVNAMRMTAPLQEIEFSNGGHVAAVYGDEVISGDDKHTWTREFWLRKWNSSAFSAARGAIGGKPF